MFTAPIFLVTATATVAMRQAGVPERPGPEARVQHHGGNGERRYGKQSYLPLYGGRQGSERTPCPIQIV